MSGGQELEPGKRDELPESAFRVQASGMPSGLTKLLDLYQAEGNISEVRVQPNFLRQFYPGAFSIVGDVLHTSGGGWGDSGSALGGGETETQPDQVVERLREQIDSLKSQNIGKDRIITTYRRQAEAAREDLEQTQARLREANETCHILAECVRAERKSAIIAHEAHEGLVTDVLGDEVLVVFEREGERLEQLYEASQFRDGGMPSPGDWIQVRVIVEKVLEKRDPERLKPFPPGMDEVFESLRKNAKSGTIDLD